MVAIVSGSARGIGRAVSAELASEDASVMCNDVDEVATTEAVGAVPVSRGQAVACVGHPTGRDIGDHSVNATLDFDKVLDRLVRFPARALT